VAEIGATNMRQGRYLIVHESTRRASDRDKAGNTLRGMVHLEDRAP
jgi:hypothetical protein